MSTIAGLPVGPVRIVAELSNAHNGDFARALAIIDAAKEAGADAVKFQAYTPDELVQLRGEGAVPPAWKSRYPTMRALYSKAQTPHAWLPKLAQHCRDISMPWFSSVFGLGSLAVLEALECPTYKLAALDHGKRTLLNAVMATGKPLVRSCANPTKPSGPGMWLYCPPGYPQAPASLPGPLRRYDGFSYHGTSWLVPLLAAAWGANVLEVHVQLDDEPSELEVECCVDMTALARLVKECRGVEAWR